MNIKIEAVNLIRLTMKAAVDMAYMPLFQLSHGELYVGAFHIGTINCIICLLLFNIVILTSIVSVSIWLMDSPYIVKFEIHIIFIINL